MNELETISVGSLPVPWKAAPEGVHEPGPDLHGAFAYICLWNMRFLYYDQSKILQKWEERLVGLMSS